MGVIVLDYFPPQIAERGPTTSPGLEPGPPYDGLPDGQGGLPFGAGTDRAWMTWR